MATPSLDELIEKPCGETAQPKACPAAPLAASQYSSAVH